jgi:hypothetical protein
MHHVADADRGQADPMDLAWGYRAVELYVKEGLQRRGEADSPEEVIATEQDLGARAVGWCNGGGDRRFSPVQMPADPEWSAA